MKNESLAFDGAAGDGVNRASNKYAKNQWSGHSNDGRDVRFGRGPTKGNSDGKVAGPSTASGTAQKRNPGGTRKWEPKAGQNYNGNPDRINAGPGPRKGNQQ